MICHLCGEKYHNEFLFAYQGYSVRNGGKPEDTEILNESVEISEDKDNSINKGDGETIRQNTSTNLSLNESIGQKGEKEKICVNDKCFLAHEKVQSLKSSKPAALFMLQGWREQLCKCSECIKKYQELSLDYLLDQEDTVHHYENKTETTKTSQYEDGMKVLSEMDRSKQIEAIHGYNSMKSNLMEYLKKFAENKKVVREEDIQEFFQQMAGNKKMRVSIPDNCK